MDLTTKQQLDNILTRIEALATNAHWTMDRRWRIAELAAKGRAITRLTPGERLDLEREAIRNEI